MLRFNILVSTLPLLIAGLFARGDLVPAAQPCIAVGTGSMRIAQAPWQAQSHVSFTDDPTEATVRVQIVDRVEEADFVMVDDAAAPADGACPVNAATRYVGITDVPSPAEPVIYLSHKGRADYRIFVQSRSFTARDAAALLVGAAGASPRRVAAAL